MAHKHAFTFQAKPKAKYGVYLCVCTGTDDDAGCGLDAVGDVEKWKAANDVDPGLLSEDVIVLIAASLDA